MPKASVSIPVTFPPGFGWADFGAIPESFVTCMLFLGCGCLIGVAWQALVGSLKVKKDDSILIRGGTSSVGLATAELAKLYGCSVFSTTRSLEKAKKLAPLVGGDNHVIVDDGKVGEEVMKRTDGRGVDYCVELVASDASLKDSSRALKPNGTLCLVGILSNILTLLD
jgi:NADPH:quinone reductase-like Zn-dependent oxidoreductase